MVLDKKSEVHKDHGCLHQTVGHPSNSCCISLWTTISTSWWDCMKCQGNTKVFRIHPLWNTDICKKCHVYTSKSCWWFQSSGLTDITRLLLLAYLKSMAVWRTIFIICACRTQTFPHEDWEHLLSAHAYSLCVRVLRLIKRHRQPPFLSHYQSLASFPCIRHNVSFLLRPQSIQMLILTMITMATVEASKHQVQPY